ncbi:hypothetical protein DNK47_00590 [Mycoplasma wenyonii]|uniref:Uncharacterized protein n=1 Tax=Mycoplasma wenyonii TaxID=65123 RepID=A0A328PJM7_9MOLU|nr:hypothetical protein DNK47_00590 [Mycoplasma wenyonii]
MAEASNLVDLVWEKLDDIWRKKCYLNFQNACINYLLEEASITSDKVKEEITRYFQRPDPKNYGNIYLKLMKETWWVNNTTLKDELISFLSLFAKHVSTFQFSLEKLNYKYNRWKQIILLYIFLLIGASEKFLINRHTFKDSFLIFAENNYLSVPSNFHQKINPKETIFILAKTQLNEEKNLFNWTKIQEKINQLQTRPEKIFLFTLDSKLNPSLLLEFQNNNVQLVTTKSIIEKHYINNEEIIPLEDLLKLCKEKQNYWDNYKFSKEEKHELARLLRRKLKMYSRLPILKDFYQQQLDQLDKAELETMAEDINKKTSEKIKGREEEKSQEIQDKIIEQLEEICKELKNIKNKNS